jgi:hypothetical protein
MSKKDFQLIANVLKAHQDGSDADHVVRGLAMSFAIELAKTNPRFNVQRFVKACTDDKS